MPVTLAPTEAWRASITARMTAVNDMLDVAVLDLTLEQANHVERAEILPIAFSLSHVVGSQDRSVSRFLAGGRPTLWDEGGWAARVKLIGERPFRGTPIADAQKVRFGDIDEWRAYQTAVFARTEHLLTNEPLDVFARDAFSGERPDLGRNSFLGLYVPSGTIRVMDICEAYLFAHACRHLGEIEHARALVGLGGVS